MKVLNRLQIARNWLPRYTGMQLDHFGDYILLTNFKYYLSKFAERFKCDVYGEKRPMQAATNNSGLTIINFSMGSPNAATIMDLLCARQPKGGDLDLHALPGYPLARLGYLAEDLQEIPVQRAVLEQGERGVEEMIDLAEIGAAVDQYVVFAETHDRLRRDIGFIDDLAHQLLEDVFESDQAVHTAVLVDHDAQVDAALLKVDQ